MDRLCLFCKHFEFYMGDPGYSELTPSSHAVIQCQKNVWAMEEGNEREYYKKCMRMAKNCKDYEPEVQ